MSNDQAQDVSSFTDRLQTFARQWPRKKLKEVADSASPRHLRRFTAMLKDLETYPIREVFNRRSYKTDFDDCDLWQWLLEDYFGREG